MSAQDNIWESSNPLSGAGTVGICLGDFSIEETNMDGCAFLEMVQTAASPLLMCALINNCFLSVTTSSLAEECMKNFPFKC